MKAILVGYGGMGKEVERALMERGHSIAARIDTAPGRGDSASLTEEIARAADVAIEFSTADAVIENAKRYARFGLNAVVGTTGWLSRLEELKAIVASSSIGYLYGANFSIGAHLFFRIVGAAARTLDSLPEYDILAWEVHHKRKKDSPSGTALSLARVITSASGRKRKIVTEKLDRAIAPEELHVASVRGGEVPGIHTVLLDSLFDTVEITHTARSRGGFALGAVRGAEWLAGGTAGRPAGRKGLFEVSEFIGELLGGAA